MVSVSFLLLWGNSNRRLYKLSVLTLAANDTILTILMEMKKYNPDHVNAVA